MNPGVQVSRLSLGRVLVTRRLKASCLPSDILPLLCLHSRRGADLIRLVNRPSLARPFVATYETPGGAGVSISTDVEQGTTLVCIAAEVTPSGAEDLESWILSSSWRGVAEAGWVAEDVCRIDQEKATQ